MTFITNFAQYYTTYTTTQSTEPADPATILAILLVMFVLFVVFYAVYAFLLGRVFKKAGEKQWIAWVPFYNTWKLLELGGQQGFWAVLAIIPIVNYVSAVFTYIAMYQMGLKFGKSGAFVLWAIFLPIVWLVWLAFDKSVWTGIKPATVVDSTPAQVS